MIEFKINHKLPSLNDYINALKSPQGQYKGAKMKREVDQICGWYILPKKRLIKAICENPVVIWYHWHEATKRRDKDNVFSASKYILDSMQECGVLKNDNNRYIEGIFNSIEYDGTDGVDVKIYSVDEYEQFLKDYFEQIKEIEK